MKTPEIEALGEKALIVRLSHDLDVAVNKKVRSLADAIRKAGLAGITDVVPANSSIGVYFERADLSGQLTQDITALLTAQPGLSSEPKHLTHQIPVMYKGPDLAEVAAKTGLSVDEVIEIHSSREYQVFAIGFAPGFGYLGEVDERISVPRRAEPRPRVAAGSVAIANRQTAIYPLDTPGGWNLIGSTDVRVFDIGRDSPSLFSVGDSVRFVPQ